MKRVPARLAAVTAAAMAVACGSAGAARAQGGPYQIAALALQDDLSRLSIEELALVEVTSVSRRPQSLAEAAAAIFVITRDDIRRSGVSSLPEALRLAPNLNVQRVNAVDYAITARGFNGFETSNKLQVLIDGRSIYSTLSSGVFWDQRDVMLDEVERIEVISGPGGALYGANAMNGVINIITRSALDTAGGLVTAGGGNEDATLALRYGGRLGDGGGWRAYLTGFSRDDSLRLTGEDATDAADGVRGGARLDQALGQGVFTLQGDVFDNTVAINEDFSGTATHARGGNLLVRWAAPAAGGTLIVQAYYDRAQRSEPQSLETNDAFDLSLQQTVSFGRHTLVAGGGYRTVRSAFQPAPGGAFLDPAERTITLGNLFLHDEVALTDTVALILAAKLEDNSFSGRDFLPSVRLAWSPTRGGLVWAAVSRASRTPNRIERDLTLPGFLVGADFQSEHVTAYELGYRANPTPALSLSISTFFNRYEDLRTVSFTPVTFLPLSLTNFGRGETYGLEAWGSYDVTPAWRLSAGVSTLRKDFDTLPAIEDISALVSAGDDPDYQVLLRSQSRLSDRVDLDLRLRAVGALQTTDSYVEVDSRVGWRVTPSVELSLTGQNLVNERRVETGDPNRRRAFGRSFFAAVRLLF